MTATTKKYVQDSAPGTYDHRALECSIHGVVAHFRGYKTSEPYECTVCHGATSEGQVQASTAENKAPERAVEAKVESKISADEMLPKEIPSFVRTTRGVGQYVYTSSYSDAEFRASVSQVKQGMLVVTVRTSLSVTAGMLGLAAKEILGDKNVRIMFSEADAVLYKFVMV